MTSENGVLAGKTAVITGGTGVLGRRMTETLARAGARVAVLGRDEARGAEVERDVRDEGLEATFVPCDVLDPSSLREAHGRVQDVYGPTDVLVAAAGGNHPEGTTNASRSFFDLEPDVTDHVMRLNFLGAVTTCQTFGRDMAERGEGAIVNVASMASFHPMTRVLAYGAAKAAVVNLTEWLAVHMAQEYGPGIRVNALAPGFFLTEQNRFLLTDADTGEPTARGDTILRNTPMGRYGRPEDLDTALRFLVDPASAFVTGIVVPVDGGFLSFSGV